MTAEEDYKLLQYGVGFTNMVQRPTKGSADLTRKEIKEGSRILLEKIQKYQPKIAVFNGKLIFEVFSGKKDFCFGKQPETVEGTNTVSSTYTHRKMYILINIYESIYFNGGTYSQQRKIKMKWKNTKKLKFQFFTKNIFSICG